MQEIMPPFSWNELRDDNMNMIWSSFSCFDLLEKTNNRTKKRSVFTLECNQTTWSTPIFPFLLHFFNVFFAKTNIYGNNISVQALCERNGIQYNTVNSR